MRGRTVGLVVRVVGVAGAVAHGGLRAGFVDSAV
jgi:hypothetical protein